MKSLCPKVLLVVCTSALAGCGTTVLYTPTNAPPTKPVQRSPDEVHVFTTGGPALPYTEVGIIQGRQDSASSFDEMPQILAEMRAEAGRRGCDGLVITGRADEAEGFVSGNQNFVHGFSGTREGLMGACVVYVDAPSAATVAVDR